jgi:predicted unusual protein kinase regulating ubiquinone biosynthesis (AarF/ABC1/UbiB family)
MAFAVLLDHGIYRELDQKFRLDYCQLWKALILLDANKILELGEVNVYFSYIYHDTVIIIIEQ